MGLGFLGRQSLDFVDLVWVLLFFLLDSEILSGRFNGREEN